MTQAKSYRISGKQQITFHPEQNNIIIDQQSIHLEPLQSRLLLFFLENHGYPVKASQIAESVWDRPHVSENLVRQAISHLRHSLQDSKRPFSVIQTIPKQGYLFDLPIEVVTDNSPQPEAEKTQPFESTRQSPFQSRFYLPLIAVLIVVIGWLGYQLTSQPQQISPDQDRLVPLVIHDIALDQNQAYPIAQSVYEYLFFGLNSSRQLISYRRNQLESQQIPLLEKTSLQLKSRLKKSDDQYQIKVIIEYPKNRQPAIELVTSFDKDNFFDAIGDLVLEIKTRLNVAGDHYDISRHKITSIDSMDDWNILARGISYFYQGQGVLGVGNYPQQLETLKQAGRDYYLLSAMDSYLSSMRYVNSGLPADKQHALLQAQSAFEQNPRCTIANATLGLALLLDQKSEQAYPYLFYAAESSPNPLNYYLLSVADQLSNNPRGAEYYYHRFSALKKTSGGELFRLNQYLQNSNIHDK